MTDPWEDVRKEIDNVMRFYMDGVDVNKTEALLADADALLTVVKERLNYALDCYEVITDDANAIPITFEQFLSRDFPSLAALPEHLR